MNVVNSIGSSSVTAKAKCSYKAKESSDRQEISFRKREMIVVLCEDENGWMKGRNEAGSTGWFPSSAVQVLSQERPQVSESFHNNVSGSSVEGNPTSQLKSIEKEASKDVLRMHKEGNEIAEKEYCTNRNEAKGNVELVVKDGNSVSHQHGTAGTENIEDHLETISENTPITGKVSSRFAKFPFFSKFARNRSREKEADKRQLLLGKALYLGEENGLVKGKEKINDDFHKKGNVEHLENFAHIEEENPNRIRKNKNKKKYGHIRGESNDHDDEEIDESSPIFANSFAELPLEIQKKLEKCELDKAMLDKHFEVLCNVLRFTMKKTIIILNHSESNETRRLKSIKEQKAKDSSSKSGLNEVLIKGAETTIFYSMDPSKLYKKATFAGKGGFGRVFYAQSIKEKTKHAIKKMPHQTPKEKRMNFDEIAVLNFCRHPNIVQYFRTYIFNEEASVIMEFMEGGTLSEATKRYAFDENQIAYIAKEMLKGIQYLHEHNLIHRDLKSSNVMLSTSGEVKLIDFGLTVDASKCKVHMVGSPFWMPPEMIQCISHSFSADIWSFAISLIEMADKRPPSRKSRIKAMFLTATEGLEDFVREHTKYSQEFKDFLLLCLKMDPSERASPLFLLKHRFLAKAITQAEMKNVLREIFIATTIEQSGLI